MEEVKIGNQVWTTKNLNVDKFCNGETIPEVKTLAEWIAAGENKQPAWCYYGNNPANGDKYGKLYNWYAVTDARGLAPKGFHVPSDAEWTVLTDFLGGEDEAGRKMKSTNGWDDDYDEGNGTDDVGFAGLPGGSRDSKGAFNDVNIDGYWWSSSEYNTNHGWSRDLFSSDGSVGRLYENEGDGFSVRCLRD